MDGDLSSNPPTATAVPATPQPYDAHLLPTPSQQIAQASSPSQAHELQFPTYGEIDHTKYGSPPPPSSSMTPPPSSQAVKRPVLSFPLLRAVTPTLSILSSPPPTNASGVKRESSIEASYFPPATAEIDKASSTELREMLHDSIAENNRLNIKLSEARMLSAHHKLQHNLLSIETKEAIKRMDVEHELTRKEVEILQTAEQSRQARQQSHQANADVSRYITELKSHAGAIQDENAALLKRLAKVKGILAEKDEDIMAVMEDSRCYLQRIRENREHLNVFRGPGGIYTRANQAAIYPTTPQQYTRGTPKQTPHSIHRSHEKSQDSFAALLMADRVLNQGSAPTTPTASSRQMPKYRLGHNRTAQSMSSLPSTPTNPRASDHRDILLPAAQLVPQSEPPHYRTHHASFMIQPKERSRRSRDSTISASDAEDIGGYSTDEEIDESRASQTASAMLRRDPRESFEVIGTPTPQSAAEKSGLLQAKIFGSVTKPGLEKRKRGDDAGDYKSKKLRLDGEGVGLGIGGLP